MKRYWITIGIVLTITGVLVIVGEIVRINRKDILSEEVQLQMETIPGTFDKEPLEQIYNDQDKIIVDRTELE